MKPEHMTVSLGCMSDGDTASWVDAQGHSGPNLEGVEELCKVPHTGPQQWI